MLPTSEQLAEQLVRMIGIRLLDPLEILLDGDDGVDALRSVVRIRAESWARRMRDGDDQSAVRLIVRVISTLYPTDEPFDPPVDWWGTPMGQLLAWRVGHPIAESVSYPVAAAMLGITRQGVHDLISRGKLARHPAGGVVPASIRDRLRRAGSSLPPGEDPWRS